jgi:putative tricarboxylic transport membrane protein
MPAHSVPALADCRTRLACGTEPTLSTRRHVLRAGVAAWLAPAMTTLHAQASWHPTERVTYVIGVAPGGTVDLYARGIKEQLEALKLVHGQTVLPENRVGAGGAIALQALAQQAGNGHWLGTFHTGAIAGAVTGLIRADVRQFPPVAMMVEETSVVAVRADAPLKSAAELVAALKANPASLKIAVAPALGQNTHMAIAKPLKTAGVAIDKLTIAPFRSSAESVTALLGGHVDVVSATAPVVVPHVQAGKLRILASAAAERGSGPLAEVRTWREQGVAADYVSYNGVMLPPRATPEQLRFWEAALQRVSQSPDWVALVEKSGNKAIFRGREASQQYLDAEWKATVELATELGLAAR